ncbi:unnamed protein product [Rotaria sordida]|uniref:Uncharacterized protein n=1 Tax=Rotaria sordida TaxID=392033 RepID=A0A818V1M5_9BILA|nr:unnamed protein product [Rotaria sordida]
MWRNAAEEFDRDYMRPTIKHHEGNIKVWGYFSRQGVGNLVFVDGILTDENPDLNPIENLWNELNHYVRKRILLPKNEHELKQMLDISKVFAFLRAQLQTKEKELLELQRVNPCLLAPDSDQIGMVVDAIASLELSTQEGSFVFASTSVYDDALLCTYDCSTGLNSIKTLPSSVWLAQSNPVKQKNEQQSFIFSHLLSLPINAYLASSSPFFGTTAKTQNQSLNRIPMINPLLFMPIDTFKASSKISMSTTLKDNKNVILLVR